MPDGTETAPVDRALALMGELSAVDPSGLKSSTPLAAIGFDSLAFAELAAALEEELGLDLGGADLAGDGTVGDVLREVERAKPSSGPVAVPPGIGRLQPVSGVLGGPALRWWFRLEVDGAEQVPKEGPVVLAMNHESAMDIPIFVIACPRRITFMSKKEVFKGGFVARSLHELGGFRVDRERFDLRAVRIAIAALERGDLLGMYPEATRAPGELLPFLHGAAWLALRTGAPLVPAAISGTERAGEATTPGRVRVRVAFGQPIRFEPVKDARERLLGAGELTRELRAAIETELG